MSDQNTGKKMVEQEELRPFLEAYKHVTGEALKCVREGESPDFVCTRPTGEEVGVELTRVTRSPDEGFADRVLLRKDEQDGQGALDEVFRLLEQKEAKRVKEYGRFAGKTILALQLFDCSLGRLLPFLDDSLRRDFSDNGFLEVWLADYTGVDAYGDIELFGLKPPQWRGYHKRPNPSRKPYG